MRVEATGAPNEHSWTPRGGDLFWIAALLVGLFLPVGALARWFGVTYTATEADVVAGVQLLKWSLVALAAAALALRRIEVPAGPGTPAALAPVTDAQGWMLAAVLCGALVLRLYRLDTELWIDEILLRTRYAPLEIRQLLSTYDSQNHQPLYSLLARASFVMTGGADWSLRLPAVLFGVGSLWALWRFGRQVTSDTESLLAVLVLSVSYHHIWFSQNARGYTATMFFALVTTGLFLRLCAGERAPHRLAWGYAILMALSVYTHLAAALVAVGHAGALLLTTRWHDGRDRSRLWWPSLAIGLSALLTITLYAPILPQVVREIMTPATAPNAAEWTNAGWMLREAARVLTGGIPGGLVTVATGLVVVATGVASYWRQSRLTTLAMFVPLPLTMAALVATNHNLWPRFFFFGAGFVVLAAIRGGFVLVRAAVRWQPDRVATVGACGVALLSLWIVPAAWQPKQQFRAALEFVEGERRTGDAVAVLDIASEMYLLRGWAPSWHPVTSLEELGAIERAATRTWIVYTLPARFAAREPELYRHVTAPPYAEVRTFPATVGGGEIHVRRSQTASHDE
jgi:mannosyltransferase